MSSLFWLAYSESPRRPEPTVVAAAGGAGNRSTRPTGCEHQAPRSRPTLQLVYRGMICAHPWRCQQQRAQHSRRHAPHAACGEHQRQFLGDLLRSGDGGLLIQKAQVL